MAKNTSLGNVKVAWILDSALTDKRFPAASELNGALDLSDAISWANYKLGADKSGDIDDRAITDLGSAISRGAAAYAATLSMFRDLHNTDASSVYRNAFEAFRTINTVGWLVTRVNKPASADFAAGEEISIYKFIAGTIADEASGENSTKFTVTFLSNGDLAVHTMVGAAGVISGVATTKTASIADGPYQLQPIVSGASIVSRATYSSDDTTKVIVSSGGTVSPVGAAADSANITVSYGAATAPVTQAVTIAA